MIQGSLVQSNPILYAQIWKILKDDAYSRGTYWWTEGVCCVLLDDLLQLSTSAIWEAECINALQEEEVNSINSMLYLVYGQASGEVHTVPAERVIGWFGVQGARMEVLR